MLVLFSYTINFSITDAITGYGIRATVKINDTVHKTTENGFLTLDLKEGKYSISVEAKGYRELKTTLNVDKTTPKDINFMLMPLEIPQPPKPKNGYAIWYGWVVDEKTRTPLEGVNVQVNTPYGSYNAKTDNKGYYYVEFPVKGSNGEKPLEGKVIFSKNGYTTFEKTGIFILEGVQRLNAQLSPGNGRVIKKKEHGINIEKQSEDFKKKSFTPSDEDYELHAPLLIPPSTIKVGTNCSCRSCSSVSIVSLETYVQYGLDDEWIASWNAHSLRAGAIPYRSYGAWHVLNPINSSYDICNSACCQVWDPSDSYSSTVNAAIYTSGIMLENSGTIARSEYSAENNDCGCGDGVYWPCISDPVCTGHSCYGHGRGMCQWGSSRWANNGYTWKWINEHYYSPGGYRLSTPMYITSISASPTNVCIGDTFTIYVNIRNYAEDTHNQIMIGASLYNGSYYSDPPNDRKITVPSGSSTGSRIFVVPSGTPAGTYDLLVALWFDVDENNAINSGDFMMYMVSQPSLINVCLTSVDEEISKLTKNGGKVYRVDGKIVKGIENKGVYFIVKDGKVKKVIRR
ncbi:MAG: SpoIID/LytB domain-containing protein [candidate division WOR-3 bacterium]